MKIDKRDNRRNVRIDPVDAVIDAHYCRMHDTAASEAVDLDGAMSDYLALMGWT
jgi:phage terminase large subunit-like protein